MERSNASDDNENWPFSSSIAVCEATTSPDEADGCDWPVDVKYECDDWIIE